MITDIFCSDKEVVIGLDMVNSLMAFLTFDLNNGFTLFLLSRNILLSVGVGVGLLIGIKLGESIESNEEVDTEDFILSSSLLRTPSSNLISSSK